MNPPTGPYISVASVQQSVFFPRQLLLGLIVHSLSCLSLRSCSSSPFALVFFFPLKPEPEGGKLSKTQQLKKIFKEYGAVGVSFHICISLMSLGMFYLLVSR